MMPVEFDVLLPPLAAGLLVLSSHLLLGEQVLRRGILFIDLAVAQLAGLGSLLAQQRGATPVIAASGGMLLAISGAVLIGRWARLFPQQREAIIGLIYAGAASVLLLVLSADPHAGHRLSRSLNGDILWVDWSGMMPLALLTPVFLLLWSRRGHWLAGRAFYPCFALLVSLSVPLLGIYLVFVTLIAPALVGQSSGGRRAAILTGSLGYAVGLITAWWLDWPAGAAVVLALLGISTGWFALSRLYDTYSTTGSSYSGSS